MVKEATQFRKHQIYHTFPANKTPFTLRGLGSYFFCAIFFVGAISAGLLGRVGRVAVMMRAVVGSTMLAALLALAVLQLTPDYNNDTEPVADLSWSNAYDDG